LFDDARRARDAARVAAPNAEARDVARESVALADLGEYAGHKLRAATALSVFERSGRVDYLAAAKRETRAADDAWRLLGVHTAYIQPFEERLRMEQFHASPYHWSQQDTADDARSIDVAEEAARGRHFPARQLPDASAFLDTPRRPGPGLANL